MSRLGRRAVARVSSYALSTIIRVLSGVLITRRSPIPMIIGHLSPISLQFLCRTGPRQSGSSAIAGFRPHRSHRAALPQWAVQDGPEADESAVPRLMESRLRQWEGGQDRLVGRPAHAAFLASLAEHLPPEPDDAVLEHAQGPIVEDHAVVPVVTPQDLAEPAMLLPHRGVHPLQQVLPDGLQLPHHTLGLRLPFDHEPTAPGPSAVVREAQEVEGLRASLPGSCLSLGGEPPELDQPGLALVERQAELRQPVLELREKLPRLCLVLTADHQVE